MELYSLAVSNLYLKRAEKAAKELRKKRFSSFVYQNCADANAAVSALIPKEAFVVAGDSLTVRQVGILETLKSRKQNLVDPFADGAEDYSVMGEAFRADYFITGANGITLDGKIIAMDSIGNRVAPMIYGPKHVVIIVGANKIVESEAEAVNRIQYFAAPANAIRLNKNTPCVKTGICQHCSGKERICNVKVVLTNKPRFTEVTVFIITKTLGL